MTFLEVVNRIFRANGIIQGDTDEITSFSDTQHLATTQLAIIAVQDELIDLIARKMVDNERTSGSLSISASTRAYSLASNFISFEGTPHFLDSDKQIIPEYPGGLNQLRLEDQNWDTAEGKPIYWYWDNTTTKRVGFWPVPDASDTFTYAYEKSILISGAGETLPLITDEEAYVFTQMAGRRFKFMFETAEKPQDIVNILDNDVSYNRARATLYRLMRGQEQSSYYGHYYPVCSED
jgi:hypothetical protein